MAKCGVFDDKAGEYVIQTPHTPVKWINYVGTLEFGGLVDHTGGALICCKDPALNRITKYIPQLPDSDFKGETLYLRIHEDDGYKVFSPLYVPTLDSFQKFECRVGLGYNRYITEFYGLRLEMTVFVPLNATCLLKKITVTNLNKKPVTVDAVSLTEFTHFDALKQFANADWVPQTMQSRAHWDDRGYLTLEQYAFMHKRRQVNYSAGSLAPGSFETDRKLFLGNRGYGTFARPESLQQPQLGNHEANRGDNIHAILYPLGALQPGKSQTLITQLGQVQNLKSASEQIHHFRSEENFDNAFVEMGAFWKDYLGQLEIKTEDGAFNTMLNIHNPRQCFITKNWSRYLSLYQLGLGARGIGFRDSSQDLLGVMDRIPKESKPLMESLLSVQKERGSAMHQFNPLTMEANEGDSREEPDRPDYYGDDHLWIVLTVSSYLKETGDLDFLRKELPFYPDSKTGIVKKGTVLDHLNRAISFTAGNLGDHGLPLLGFADWNDSVNLKTGAESFFVASLYGKALLEMADLYRHLNDNSKLDNIHLLYESMRETFRAVAWDGAWFRRYIDWDGQVLGSSENREGQIFCNAQSWPVIAGFADPDQAVIALDSLHERLNTRYGIKLSAPGFSGFDPAKGGVTTYPPGAKENGGIFLHANPWVIMAECLMGRGNRAYEYYQQINPAAKNDSIEIFECEPYVYPQNILGDEHPQFGLARNSWLSGTASWMYTAGTKYILGIRPHYEGLIVDPCIPNHWDEFEVKRIWRNQTYRIHVKNPEHVSHGVAQMSVNGKQVKGKWVPLDPSQKEVRVALVMGKAGEKLSGKRLSQAVES